MARYSVEYHSRYLYAGPSEASVAECINARAFLEVGDDADVENNDLSIDILTDRLRKRSSQSMVLNKQVVETDELGIERAIVYTGTRRFQFVTEPDFHINNLRGYFYDQATPNKGRWARIIVKDLFGWNTVETIPLNCDRVRLQAMPSFRNAIEFWLPAGLYGSFFKYIVKKLMPINGMFKFLNFDFGVQSTNLKPEFLVAMEATETAFDSDTEPN